MTSPANKKRTHNDAARAAKQKVAGGGAERSKPMRRSPYGKRIEDMRKRREKEGKNDE